MKVKRYIRDLTKRKIYKDNEIFQRLFKILQLQMLDNNSRFFFHWFSNKIVSKYVYKSQVRNICIFSGRSRAVLREWKVSRIFFRELTCKGFFFGIQKGSW
jgi:ribosomal protein S14